MKNSLSPLPAMSQRSFKLFNYRPTLSQNLKSSGSCSPIFAQKIGLSYSPSKNIRTPSLVAKSSKLKYLNNQEANLHSRREILTQRKNQDKNQIQRANKRIQDAIQVKRLFKIPHPAILNINLKFDLQ